MTPAADTVPRRKPGAELVLVDGQAVMLDAAGTRALGLNASAARVWELIDGVRTAAHIASELHQNARVEDVLGFLEALRKKGLIEVP